MSPALSIAVVIATLLLVVFALYQVVNSFKTRAKSPPDMAQAMTRRIEALASRIGEINAGHDAAHAAIAGLDPGATIDDALAAFILHAPGASLAADGDALGKRFDDTRHAPFLAAIAGLALREPESAQAGTSAKLVRHAVADVLRRAPPALASDLAQRLARDDPDRWTWLAGEGRILRQVATRLRPLDASEAGRVEALDQDLARHRTKRDIEEAERQLAFYEGRAEVDSTYVMATEFVRWSLLPASGLYERFDGLVARNSGYPSWRELRLRMDLILIERNLHRDVAAAIARIAAGFDDPEPFVVDTAAEVATDLVEQGHLDDDFRARMRAGLERARARHGPKLSGLDRLEAALVPLAQSHPLNDARASVSPTKTMTRMRDAFNAFLDRDEPSPPSAPDGPLAGLTLAVKDIYDIAGQKTGGGNPQKLAEAKPATRTAPAVQALLDAGARFAGRTQTDELTFSLMGQNAHYPFPVNPAAPDRVTGGSSSGSAAAVAGGLADIALGSDTGGSIRGPASFCGLVGLRLTHGAVSLDGAMPLAPSLDTFGWFARDIETYARVADVLLPAAPDTTRRDWKPLRLAVLDDLLLGPTERAEYDRMVASVAGVVGAPSSAAPFSQSIDDLYWAFRRIQAAEAWAVHGPFISSGDRRLGPGVKERFEFGSTIDAASVERERAVRSAFRAELAGMLGDDGLLVLPTMPGAAPLTDTGFDDIQAYRERALRLLCLSGLSGFPQITLPLGRVDGAPFGLSLLGPEGSDRALIELAGAILETSGKT